MSATLPPTIRELVTRNRRAAKEHESLLVNRQQTRSHTSLLTLPTLPIESLNPTAALVATAARASRGVQPPAKPARAQTATYLEFERLVAAGDTITKVSSLTQALENDLLEELEDADAGSDLLAALLSPRSASASPTPTSPTTAPCTITTEFESNAYSMTKAELRDSHLLGTLSMVFLHYAKLGEQDAELIPKLRQITFESIVNSSLSITFTEFSFFCRDFRLFPELCTKSEIAAAFRAANSGKTTGAGTMVDALTYYEFANALAQLAVLIYSKPAHAQDGETHSHRIRRFVKYLRLPDTAFIKKRLSHLRSVAKFRERQDFAQFSSFFLRRVKEQHKRTMNATDFRSRGIGAARHKPVKLTQRDMWPLMRYNTDTHKHLWIAYPGSFLDMGTISVRDLHKHSWRVSITNMSAASLESHVSFAGVPWLIAKYTCKRVAPGMKRIIQIRVDRSVQPDEYLGVILAVIRTVQGEHAIKIPVYANIVS